jgi:hypothetical protein
LETAVDQVFPRVEHRECMQHLAEIFGKYSKEILMRTYGH